MSTEEKTIAAQVIELNEFIHASSGRGEYHMAHIADAAYYAIAINKRTGEEMMNEKLMFIGVAHDLLKERSLDPTQHDVIWKGHPIPQDLNRYVRQNLDVLAQFALDDYFNSDIQLHPLAAGIFLYKEFGIDDPELLYPIFFHSCPIMEVYETLDIRTKAMVDAIVLADKLSSNYLRINLLHIPVKIDLDLAVFGQDGQEFNYTMGLFLARLLSQKGHPGTEALKTTAYYQYRAMKMNPFIRSDDNYKTLGGKRLWDPRKSVPLETARQNLFPF